MSELAVPLALQKVDCGKLNARQKETYNFQRVAARLAEYGYNSILLSDDWLGADFIAYHNDGERFYRVQLKGRMTIDKKYFGKDLYIAFIDGDRVFVYPHDQMVRLMEAEGRINDTASCRDQGAYTWPSTPAWLRHLVGESEVT